MTATTEQHEAMTETGEHRVFVYGILKTKATYDDPPAAVRGAMFRGPFACAKFDVDGIVRGEVRVVDSATLREWDRIEGTESGLYRRVVVKTVDGVSCWAYEWARDVERFNVIEDGVWRAPCPW